MLVLDPNAQDRLIRERRANGQDRWDEVWEGVYVLMPNPNVEHHDIATGLSTIFRVVVDWRGLGKVFQGINVSDRVDDWTRNYRCPDVAVYLHGNPAVNCGTHWRGGPDFAVEVVSPDDRAREKLGFYARTGVRELLLIDRDPWALGLYRLRKTKLALAGKSTPEHPEALTGAVVPLSFRLVPGDTRPRIEVAHADGLQRWLI
ncbi:MAG TPA: Uma2 family endonuclease, partial [Isosphaeraceae bacterium]|nr:Uma2 family endonuclease [Isosphaeraceae bacterium]